MTLTKDLIEKRLTELRSSQAQLLNNVQAHEGAIKDCEYWLSVLEGQVTETTNG